MNWRQPPCHVCGSPMTAKNHSLWMWREGIGYVHTPCEEATTPAISTIPASTPCPDCGEYLNVGDWPWCPHEPIRPSHHSVHSHDRAVVYEHPGTGEVRYPGRNDLAMPERYAQEGYVRREFPTLRSLESFECSHGVRNDIAHYDSGNSADQEPPPQKRMTDRQKKDLFSECLQAER